MAFKTFFLFYFLLPINIATIPNASAIIAAINAPVAIED